jgi:hypothetical protein
VARRHAGVGVHRIAKRMAYRYYRLAKKRWQRGQRAEAREAIREATSLCPFYRKYWFYEFRWGLSVGADEQREAALKEIYHCRVVQYFSLELEAMV